MKKRLGSFILCLAMLLSLLTIPAAAAGLDNFSRGKAYTQGQYTDVAASNTFAENVKAGYEFGIMQGYGTTFGVSSNITRLASIIIASRINCIYNNGKDNIESTYSGTTQEIYLAYAKANGIYCSFSSYSTAATRAEFAVILSSALPDSALSAINTIEDGAIPDVPASASYASAVYRLYRAGILNGSDSKGTFYPSTSITRGAACAIATRMADKNLRKTLSLTASSAVFQNIAVDHVYQHTLSEADLSYTYFAFVVRNTSASSLTVDLQVRFLDSSKNVVDVQDAYIEPLGSGNSFVCFVMTDVTFASYEYEIGTETSTYKDLSSSLAVSSVRNGSKITQTVKNNSGRDLVLPEYYVLFFKNGKIVDYSWGLLTSVGQDYVVKAGDTVYTSDEAYENFDSYQIYYNVSEMTWDE